MPGSPSPVGRGAGVGGMPPPVTPWSKDLGSSNLPPGVRMAPILREAPAQVLRRTAASFSFKATIGLSTIGSTRRRTARYRLT